MKIEIWSDIGCPFCYIGEKQLNNALNEFAHKSNVTVVYHSFELDPAAPVDSGLTGPQMLVKKTGWPAKKVQQVNSQVTQTAQENGLDYDLEHAIYTNTFNAHRLIHYAASFDKASEMRERLFKANLVEAKHVGNIETLAELATDIGLDKVAVLEMLSTDVYTANVRKDEAIATEYGITGVPFFVINGRYGISGAQGKKVMSKTLQKAWHEAHPLTMVGSRDKAVCSDSICIPGADNA